MSIARVLMAALAVCSMLTTSVHAGGKPFSASVDGVLLTAADGKPLASATSVPAGQMAVVLGRAEIASANGAAKAIVVGDVGEIGPLMALEAAVRLHESKAADLELTLDRGII